jgi:hypothetical protein
MLDQAANLLVEASALDMVNQAGAEIEVWTISADGCRVRASAPRLAVAGDMQLTCRLVVDGLPHQITAIVEEAAYQSEKRAAIVLRVVDVAVDGGRRRNERIEFTATAHLTALVCDRIVPGDRMTAEVSDLSQGGVRLVTSDTRPRAGDLLRLHARFLEGAIETDIRVMRAMPSGRGETAIVGCEFVGLPAESARVITSLLERLGSAQFRVGTNMREALEPDQPPATAPAPRFQQSVRPLPSVG